jgi:hypothetical protein
MIFVTLELLALSLGASKNSDKQNQVSVCRLARNTRICNFGETKQLGEKM